MKLKVLPPTVSVLLLSFPGSVCVLLNLYTCTDIDMLEEFAYLRTTEGGRVQLELLPNQGMLIK